ncbi:MAG: type II toxin-antitoxin system ParD family antitoxin [Aphanizomenon flos-aquae KM1D3_PB]|jgi:antitoxin ParD1/3/4|uniref:ribbon-helix-helix domain-containing protein n=1 Tax=Aphanizomenon flos-aquae TaxID=1176 RepID=UPI00068C6F92|nr:CopG family transcriptional regulator [Aphanizomenon flos-aquae]QSV71497.1 MAG: type II toxin-antitoxin system ParD family antitoxin [Aphanizomenon flos-aquae KM1D3_PB]
MNIQIKPELEQIIQAQIATGRYTNPEDVISKALKLLLEWDKGYQNWVEETREKVDIAIEQLDRGEGINGDVVISQLRDKLRQAREISCCAFSLYNSSGQDARTTKFK